MGDDVIGHRHDFDACAAYFAAYGTKGGSHKGEPVAHDYQVGFLVNDILRRFGPREGVDRAQEARLFQSFGFCSICILAFAGKEDRGVLGRKIDHLYGVSCAGEGCGQAFV